jgi:hypothetical protein
MKSIIKTILFLLTLTLTTTKVLFVGVLGVYQIKQVGPKINPPTQELGPGFFGVALSMNADGTRFVVGAFKSNSTMGASYVYSYNGTQWNVESSNLVDADASAGTSSGYAVAISGDGQYVMIGGFNDNVGRGASWIYTFNETQGWNQQGLKLVGNDCSESGCFEGFSVALNYDGTLAASGAPLDDGGVGSVFVYMRNGGSGTWAQLGSKLSGTSVNIGSAVAFSYDGLTLLVGALGDNSGVGAALVFVYDSDLQYFVQQNYKLIGAGLSGTDCNFGTSVSLSSDGNTALIGAPYDSSSTGGAVYLFQRINNAWWQIGNKIVASNSLTLGSGVNFGMSVQLNADASRAIVGGTGDNNNIGAAWWLVLDGVDGITQYKVIGNDVLDVSNLVLQGFAVAINGDGNALVVGGDLDNDSQGAVWVFQAETTVTLDKLQDDIQNVKNDTQNIKYDTQNIKEYMQSLKDDIEVLKRMIQLISPPSRSPSKKPSTKPSKAPSRTPSKAPKTTKPSKAPSRAPSKAPKTTKPSKSPSLSPSKAPKFSKPSKSPSLAPTKKIG